MRHLFWKTKKILDTKFAYKNIGRARFVTEKGQLSSRSTQRVDHLLSINWEQEHPPRWAVTPGSRQHLELRRLSGGDGDEHMTLHGSSGSTAVPSGISMDWE